LAPITHRLNARMKFFVLGSVFRGNEIHSLDPILVTGF
jgi:hypothetical protein